MNGDNNTCQGCKCSHHKFGAWAIILIGVSALLAHFGVYSDGVNGIVWPILLIVFASGKLCKCC